MRVIRAAAFLAIVAAFAFLPAAVDAHTTLRNYIQHRAVISVGARNIDVTVELTFYEDCSVGERRRMDVNVDGRIAPSELQAYLDAEAKRFERDVHLTVDGKSLELIPLYDPKIDLCNDDRVTPHFHVLRLALFARTPRLPKAGALLELKDGLWPKENAVRSIEVSSKDGIRTTNESSREDGIWHVRIAGKRP